MPPDPAAAAMKDLAFDFLWARELSTYRGKGLSLQLSFGVLRARFGLTSFQSCTALGLFYDVGFNLGLGARGVRLMA